MKIQNLFQVGKEQISFVVTEQNLEFDGLVEMVLHDLQIAHMLLLGVYELVDDLLHFHFLLAQLLKLLTLYVEAQIGQLLVHLHVRVVHPRVSARRIGGQSGGGGECR